MFKLAHVFRGYIYNIFNFAELELWHTVLLVKPWEVFEYNIMLFYWRYINYEYDILTEIGSIFPFTGYWNQSIVRISLQYIFQYGI